MGGVKRMKRARHLKGGRIKDEKAVLRHEVCRGCLICISTIALTAAGCMLACTAFHFRMPGLGWPAVVFTIVALLEAIAAGVWTLRCTWSIRSISRREQMANWGSGHMGTSLPKSEVPRW